MSFEKRNPGTDRVLATRRPHLKGRHRKVCVPEGPGVVLEPSARRETARARTGRPRWHPGPTGSRNGPGSQKRNPGMNAGEESNRGVVCAEQRVVQEG